MGVWTRRLAELGGMVLIGDGVIAALAPKGHAALWLRRPWRKLLQLARDGRRLAIHSCSDLPDRLAGFAKAGNGAALFETELLVLLSHGNTLSWCCTSFVNSGGPDGVGDNRGPGNGCQPALA